MEKQKNKVNGLMVNGLDGFMKNDFLFIYLKILKFYIKYYFFYFFQKLFSI